MVFGRGKKEEKGILYGARRRIAQNAIIAKSRATASLNRVNITHHYEMKLPDFIIERKRYLAKFLRKHRSELIEMAKKDTNQEKRVWEDYIDGVLSVWEMEPKADLDVLVFTFTPGEADKKAEAESRYE